MIAIMLMILQAGRRGSKDQEHDQDHEQEYEDADSKARDNALEFDS